MKKYYLIIIILILIIITNNYEILKIYMFDIYFIIKRLLVYNFEYDNKMIENKSNDYNNIKVLIISFDNRNELKYLDFHNNNITKYCEKWPNVDYEFINKFTNECKKNVYWYKLYLMKEKLKTSNYDYIMWIDTDAIIVKDNISIQEILNSYSSDIFIGHDTWFNDKKNTTLCSGVFIIKNSEVGRQFIDDCINTHEKSNCIKKNGKLHGIWASTCYEQGIMNYMIYEKYKNNTTILNPKIIRNTYHCNKNNFILHKYGSKPEDIFNCFTNI